MKHFPKVEPTYPCEWYIWHGALHNAGSISQDLRNLTFKDKVLADEMNRLRDEHRADLVTLISDRPAGGVGWLMIRAKGMAKMGVNVLGRSSLRGYVLAHEVGHNMGCQHAEGDSGTSADGLYAWGMGIAFKWWKITAGHANAGR